MSRLIDLFDEAAAFVKKSPKEGHYAIDDKSNLTLYGLYKQATEGPCNKEKPSSINFFARQKWDSWNSFKNMDKASAMRGYVDRVDALKTKALVDSKTGKK